MTVAIGMYEPKDTRNLGSLLRSAHLYNVDFTFQVGGVAYTRAATDTSNATRHVPHRRYDSLEALVTCEILGVEMALMPRLVAVELDRRAVPLGQYQHPEHGIYLLGSENRGLPEDALAWAKDIIQVETPQPWSLNVATTGAIVLHSRYIRNATLTLDGSVRNDSGRNIA